MRCSKVVHRRGLPAAACAVLFFVVGFSASAQAANLPPTISGSPATIAYIGSQYVFMPAAADPEGKKLRFRIANKPGWASFSNNSGRLSGTPSAVGNWTNIRITVSDGVNIASLPAFSVSAQSNSNVAPTISGTPPTSVLVGSAYNFVPSANDANGDPLSFSITNKPTWASFSNATGQLSGTPTAAGTFANIVISTSDGAQTTSLPAFTITVTNPATNHAPTISGTPAASATVGSAYSFRPTASDVDGDPLGFSIQNRPSWATFSTSTGQLSGTPTAAGTFGNIVISVSDGKASAALTAFTINVADAAPPPSTGSATLSWAPPTQNTDGSSLTDLAGYRIIYGQSPTSLTQLIQISNPGISTYVIDGLQPGTYYFAVRAYSSGGIESDTSNVATKTIQ